MRQFSSPEDGALCGESSHYSNTAGQKTRQRTTFELSTLNAEDLTELFFPIVFFVREVGR